MSLSALRKELERLKALDHGLIEESVKAARFTCVRCGRCCRGAFGDNTVAVSPREIRSIMEMTGLGWLDIAVPAPVGDYDRDGTFHSFGWSLRRKPDGDCAFLNRHGLCDVYECRPWICRTYPFRYEDGVVETFECDGLCSERAADAGKMSEALLRRSIEETEEAIRMLERFESFTGQEASCAASGRYVVHDGEGSKRLRKSGGAGFIFE